MATALNHCFPWRHLLTSICAALCLLGAHGLARGSGVVTNCSEANLRAAMAGGGVVSFDCNGSIVLTGTLVIASSTTFDANGQEVTLSGNGAVQIFTVTSDAKLTLRKLNLADGLSKGVLGTSPINGVGGAVCNTGQLEVVDCVFSNNCATGGSADQATKYPGTAGQGGAIYSSGELFISNSVFVSNRATGGTGGSQPYVGGVGLAGGVAQGGAIYNLGTATAMRSCFVGDSATGGGGGNGQPSDYYGGPQGGAGGLAQGGAVYSSSFLSLEGCLVASNTVRGGNAGSPGLPSSAWNILGGSGGNGTPGGLAEGGGLFVTGTAAVADCCFSSNSALGGSGGAGGEGQRVSYGTAGPGGRGGSGGDGLGGAVTCSLGSLSMTNSTFWANWSSGGVGGPGGNGGTVLSTVLPSTGGNGGNGGNGGDAGGCVSATDSQAWICACTIAGNGVQAGMGGIAGAATYGYRGGWGVNGAAGTNGLQLATGLLNRAALPAQMQVANSIVAAGAGGPNCTGIISDGGHNLCSDGSAQFTAGSSLNNTDPKLGSLAANGGPTPTIALMPDSPAVDTGVLMPGAAQDQRGVARPYGAAPDIGAYEWNASSFYTTFRLSSPTFAAGSWQISGLGPTGAVVTLQASPDLVGWLSVVTNRTDDRGVVSFVDLAQTKWGRFYRLISR